MKCSPLLILLPACGLLLACSVKEDRGACPCELTVRAQGVLPSGGDVLVSVVQDGRVVRQGMMGREEFESGGCTLTVPRTASVVTVFAGITEMSEKKGSTLEILRGHDCDRIYSVSVPVSPKADEWECVVTPHKNYALLELNLPGIIGSSRLSVRGSVAGYDLRSSDPSDGEFGFAPPFGGESWLLRLPRQKDESLLLSLIDEAGLEKEVPLGRLIAMTGYDFGAVDLEDISMTIDIAREIFTVTVGPWEDAEVVEIYFGTESQ